MRRLVGRSSASYRLRTTGEGGFTLLEAVLVLFIASVGILSVALGLLTALNSDNRTNQAQRLNLAMTTVVDSLKQQSYLPAVCPGASTPAPRSDDPDLASNSSPAGRYLRRVVGDWDPVTKTWLLTPQGAPTGDEAVQGWIDQGVVFSITDVQYWSSDTKNVASGDGFVYSTNVNPGLRACETNSYGWPAARLLVRACWKSETVGVCDPGGGTELSTVTIHGPRGP
jgi:type II secretory pathway pseudopilin PulG